MAPTLGGVHKIPILTRDLLKDVLQKNIRRRNGGDQGDPDPLMSYISVRALKNRFLVVFQVIQELRKIREAYRRIGSVSAHPGTYKSPWSRIMFKKMHKIKKKKKIDYACCITSFVQ